MIIEEGFSCFRHAVGHSQNSPDTFIKINLLVKIKGQEDNHRITSDLSLRDNCKMVHCMFLFKFIVCFIVSFRKKLNHLFKLLFRKNDLILIMTPEKQDKTLELSKHWSADSTPARNEVIMKMTYPVKSVKCDKICSNY